MINPIPFEAGEQWTPLKTRLFNIFFSRLRLSFDWKGKDLEFLNQLSKPKSLTIESVRTIDVSAISNCRDIEEIILECKVPKRMSAVRLDQLTKLKLYIGNDFSQFQSLYANKNIRRIYVYHYNSSDLSTWRTENIEHIQIDDSSTLASLDGIQRLKNLKLVQINNCPNLKRPTLYVNDYPFLRIYVDGVSQE